MRKNPSKKNRSKLIVESSDVSLRLLVLEKENLERLCPKVTAWFCRGVGHVEESSYPELESGNSARQKHALARRRKADCSRVYDFSRTRVERKLGWSGDWRVIRLIKLSPHESGVKPTNPDVERLAGSEK